VSNILVSRFSGVGKRETTENVGVREFLTIGSFNIPEASSAFMDLNLKPCEIAGLKKTFWFEN
jgi:hypothetical protein